MMTRVSDNLRKLIEEVEEFEANAVYATLYDIEIEYRQEFNDILERHVEMALRATPEYDTYEYSEGILTAIRKPGTITLGYLPGKIIVNIDMNYAAGTLGDYIRAVEVARQTMSSKGKPATINQASHYWRIFLYGQAREGREISMTESFRTDKLGRVSSYDYRKGEGRYERTIEERISNMTGLAPWWSLLDKGTMGAGFPSRGGTPYPNNGPTNFVESAELEIAQFASGVYERKLEELLYTLRERDYGYMGFEEDIVEMVDRLEPDQATPKPKENLFTEIAKKAQNFVKKIFGGNR